MEALTAGMIYYTMESDEEGEKIGDEINIYADSVINRGVSVGACYAWASLDSIDKSSFDYDDASKIELYTYLSF